MLGEALAGASHHCASLYGGLEALAHNVRPDPARSGRSGYARRNGRPRTLLMTRRVEPTRWEQKWMNIKMV